MRLNQDEIAAKLNVSRQPVNSAISILKVSGLVESTGLRSPVVTRFDPSLFRSIYGYRKIIKPFAVRLAIKVIKGMDNRDADRVLRTGKKAHQSGKLRDLLYPDMRFHKLMERHIGNSCQADVTQIDEPINRAQQMILGHMIINRKLVKQRHLRFLLWPQHQNYPRH